MEQQLKITPTWKSFKWNYGFVSYYWFDYISKKIKIKHLIAKNSSSYE